MMLGKNVYHGVAKCFTRHPGYATKKAINTLSKQMTGEGYPEFRENLHISVPAPSSYEASFVPPDFTKRHIKSGRRVIDIYRVLNSDVNGTAMASWKGMLSPTGDDEESERNQWAVAYYVHALHKLKFDWEQRKKFFSALNTKRKKEGDIK